MQSALFRFQTLTTTCINKNRTLIILFLLSGMGVCNAESDETLIRPTGVIHAKLQAKSNKTVVLHKPLSESIDIYTLPLQSLVWPSLSLPEEQQSNHWLTEGIRQLAQGNINAAYEDFQQAMEKADSPETLYRLGQAFTALEADTLAEHALTGAAEKEPALQDSTRKWRQTYLPSQTSSSQIERLLLLAIHLKAPNGAQQNTSPPITEARWRSEQLRQIIKIAPNFAPAYRWLGIFTESSQEQIRSLQTAVKLAPGQPAYLEALGDGYALNKRYKEAEQAYTQALQFLSHGTLEKKADWEIILQGKQRLARGNALLRKQPQQSAGWQEAAAGLSLQKRPLEAKQAINTASKLNRRKTKDPIE